MTFDENSDPVTVIVLPAAGALLAIDWGEKRIGLALSNPEQTLAHPLGFLKRRAGRRFPLAQLRPYLDHEQPVGILLGLPLSPSGEENVTTATIRQTALYIHAKTNLPVDFFDERMSTARVLSAAKDLHAHPDRSGHTDALAATVILQNFLDTRR